MPATILPKIDKKRRTKRAVEDMAFRSSPEATVGVELELQILDRDTGDLVSGADRHARGLAVPRGHRVAKRHRLPGGDILTDRRGGHEAGDPGAERLPSHLDFIGPDIAGTPGGLGPRPPPLVAIPGRAAAVDAPGDSINGRAARQRGVGPGGAAVLLQGTEQRIDVEQIRGHEAAAARRAAADQRTCEGRHG